MSIEIALVGPDRHDELTRPLRMAFGFHFDPERAARQKQLPELVQRIAALDGGEIVGSAGAYRFEMTTPGGSVPVSGLTMVAVLATHRRRGILKRMMALHLEEARAQGVPVSALWASEGPIYGRFGYGMASLAGAVSFDPLRVGLRPDPGHGGVLRMLEAEEARAPFRDVYERVRAVTPGMMSRSDRWWDFRRLGDFDQGAQPLVRVALFVDGRPEAYALYRLTQRLVIPGTADTTLSVTEAMATSPRANAMLWRYLCEIDLVRRIDATAMPVPPALFHQVLDARRLHLTVEDALWVRLVDAPAALAARSFPVAGGVTFQLEDELCPWNSGVYSVSDGRAGRASGAPELRLDASALGSLYLGGVTARQLADAGRVEELAPGAVDRADTLFRSPLAPWCPEVF